MEMIISLIERHQTIIRYGLVGVLSTAIDLVLLRILTKGTKLPLWASVAIAFLCGLANGFVLNAQYTFSVDATAWRYTKYFLAAGVGLLMTEGIIYLLHKRMKIMGAFPAKLVAVVVVFVWNFLTSKYWVFI